MKAMIRGALVALWVVSGSGQAQDAEFDVGALIDRVVVAYGGSALTEMRYYEIEEAYIGPNLNQSWSPALTDLNKNNLRLIHDIEGGQAYFESYFKSRGGIFPNLITRMTRENPQFGALDYMFDDHTEVDGLMAASKVSFSVAGDPNLIGTGRQLRFNRELAAALEPLELNYNRIVTAHNARVYTARDFERSVQSFRDFDCPDDRPLCSR